MSDMLLESNQIDRDVVESKAMLGKQCITCDKILAYRFFRKDSSYRDGWRDQCTICESAPRMSTEEHLWSQREKNYLAAASQRWANQDDYRDDAARVGRQLHHSAFLQVVQQLVPNLYITEGRIEGDLAIYRIYGTPQPQLEGRTFEYLFFCPTGILPEFSQYEFSDRDVIVRESRRGWRTILLRLIKSGLLTEEKVNAVFGPAEGPGSTVYNRKLWEHRNHKNASF